MRLLLVAMAALGLASVPTTAHAYLDAGTGSMVLQAVIATVAGALVTLRLYWSRLKARFGSGSADAQTAPDEPGDGSG
jgi:hypothetical protein